MRVDEAGHERLARTVEIFVSPPLSVGIGWVEIFSILLPRTSKLDGAESAALMPSKMRTFWNKTAASGSGTWASAASVKPHSTARADGIRFMGLG